MSNAPFNPLSSSTLTTRELVTGFNILRANVLLNDLSSFPPFESIIDPTRRSFFSSEDEPEAVIFVSHRWYSTQYPDQLGEQFNAIVAFLRYLKRVSELQETAPLRRIWNYITSKSPARGLAMTHGAFQAAYFLSEYNRFNPDSTTNNLLDMCSEAMIKKIGIWYDFTCLPQDSESAEELARALQNLHELMGACNLVSLRRPMDSYDERSWCAAEVSTDLNIERSNFRKISLRIDLLGQPLSQDCLNGDFASQIGAVERLHHQLDHAQDGESLARAVGFFVKSADVEFEDHSDPPLLFVRRKPWIFAGQKTFMSKMIEFLSVATEEFQGSSGAAGVDLAKLVRRAAVAAGLKASKPDDLTYTAMLILYARHRGTPEMARMYAELLRRHLKKQPTILNWFQYDYDETELSGGNTFRAFTGRCSYSFTDTYDFPTFPLPKVNQGGIAIYVRTTSDAETYEHYESELIKYCRQQGWLEPEVYHDVVYPHSFLPGSHSKSAHELLMSALASGEFRVVVIHDLGQLAKWRHEAWEVLISMMEFAEVYVPKIGKVDTHSQIPGSSEANLWSDTFSV